MAQVFVMALLSAKEGSEDKVKEMALGLIEPTRAEKGCMLYDLHQDPGNPGDFMFYEIWQSQEDFDSHAESSHLASFGQAVGDYLAKPALITTWRKIS